MLLARTTTYAWLPLACVLLPLLTSCTSSQTTRRPPTPADTAPPVATSTPRPETHETPPAASAPAPVEVAAAQPSAPTRPLVDPAAAPVVERLAAQLMVAPESIVVTSVEPAQWPDGCLGLPAEGEICTMALTPGFAIVLTVESDVYSFRTDAAGERIRVDGAPPARTGDPLVTWRDSQSFNTMIIGTQRVATGRRGRPLIAAPLAVPARATELQALLARYAPFQAETPAGEIALRGVGGVRASATEQRTIAEWARLVSLEARMGAEQSEMNIAVTWTRRGGPAAVCDAIVITRTGTAVATSCRGGGSTPIATIALGADDMATLFEWLDRFEAFEADSPDGAEPTTALSLRGTGVDEAAEADRAAIVAWMDGIALRLREAALAK